MRSLYGKHYVGEVGTSIIIDCGRDISEATYTAIKVKKPNGQEVTWSAVKHSIDGVMNYIRYTTREGDLDQAGRYEVQSVIHLHGWEGLGKTTGFMVYRKFA